ncbi:hypothetical protein AX16_003537 [Volvariella volvacea WC 439]|nr:hypothetical protein AX16_003537 [Volvariella volvacea WC 439]
MARTSVLLFSLFTFHWQLIRVWGSVAQQVPLDQLPTNSLQDGASTSKGFPLSPIDPDEASSYKFKWPTRRIAIIGAGDGYVHNFAYRLPGLPLTWFSFWLWVRGLLAYRELTEAGLDVHIFERDHAPGGNWHYSEETPLDVPIPNVDVSIGDYAPDLPPHGVTLPYEVIQKEDDEGFRRRRRVFRGPKPVWASLTSNSPAVSSSACNYY